MTKVALLGTGLMGFPMAEKLLEAGFSTLVYNRTREKAEPLQEAGAEVADTAAAAVNSADTILLMLSDYSAINDVLFSDKNALNLTNKTVIQMGTILPEESIDLNKKILARGGDYLEAPVLGSIPNVREKRLIIMAGSTLEQFQNCEMLFRAFGSDIYWIGEVGQAAATKLALNQLIASLTAAFSISLGMVRHQNIDPEVFMSILRHSALYAPTFDKKLTQMMEREFDDPNFPTKHLLKDVNLVLSEARNASLTTTVLEAIRQILQSAVDGGLAEADYSAIYNIIHPEK